NVYSQGELTDRRLAANSLCAAALSFAVMKGVQSFRQTVSAGLGALNGCSELLNRAGVVVVMRSISAMEFRRWPRPLLCWLGVSDISEINASTRRTFSTISSTLWSTTRRICLATSALRCSTSPTSLATTLKPRPAEPARAASTAAFKANGSLFPCLPSIGRVRRRSTLAGSSRPDFGHEPSCRYRGHDSGTHSYPRDPLLRRLPACSSATRVGQCQPPARR